MSNSFNLDERIKRIRKDWVDDVSQAPEMDEEVKQLIRDVLEYVKPERLEKPPLNTETVSYMKAIERNHADIAQMEAKIKELGL